MRNFKLAVCSQLTGAHKHCRHNRNQLLSGWHGGLHFHRHPQHVWRVIDLLLPRRGVGGKAELYQANLWTVCMPKSVSGHHLTSFSNPLSAAFDNPRLDSSAS